MWETILWWESICGGWGIIWWCGTLREEEKFWKAQNKSHFIFSRLEKNPPVGNRPISQIFADGWGVWEVKKLLGQKIVDNLTIF